jgi:hypothetical protein
VLSKATEIVNNAKSGLDGKSSEFQAAGRALADSLASGINSGGSDVWAAADALGKNAESAVGWYKDGWTNTGIWMSYGLADGISRGGSEAINAAIDVARNALQAAKNELGVASPSKEFEKIGLFSDEGLAQGFEKQQNKVEEAARETAQKSLAAMKTEYMDLSNQLNYVGAGLLNQMTEANNQAVNMNMAMNKMMDGLNAMANLAESLSNPQAPNVTVMIGNKQFDGYIVDTALSGMSQRQTAYRLGVGG